MALCYVACDQRPCLVVVKQVLIVYITSESARGRKLPAVPWCVKPQPPIIKIEKDSIILSWPLEIPSMTRRHPCTYFATSLTSATTNRVLARSRRSDKLFGQPWTIRKLIPRAQGFAPHAEHWRYPQNYCICPACPPCCIPSQPCLSLAPTTTDPSLFPPSHKALQIIQPTFHQCFLLNRESLLLLYTLSAASWYHI